MLEKIHALMREKDICVLATVSGNKPHCSLMAYVTDENCREIHMVTDKLTKKYSNLTENPAASLLIDTRDEDPGSDRLRRKALTVNGVFRKMDEKKSNSVRERLLDRHPHLRQLAFQPDAAFFSIRIESLLLLEGVSDSYFYEVE